MDLTQEVIETIQKKGAQMKRKYEGGEWQFLGGRFRIHIGVIGLLTIHINSDGAVMRIETPEGAYLKPPLRGRNGY